ncbi:unnamed protein product [Phaedon cochleariae]|uniref:Double jelly roll-like domain-containing protein n=1 Tax=Phaedon cochleariae TaxID=80249 RepID=A0A9N9SHZ0_PHACE|nr:unnamed protein product [Phaedon cochleariae]
MMASAGAADLQQQMQAIMTQLTLLSQSVADIRTLLESQNKKIDECVQSVSKLQDENIDLRDKINTVQKQLLNSNNNIYAEMRNRLDREKNAMFFGISEQNTEFLQVVNEIANKISSPKPCTILSAERVGKLLDNKDRPIKVQFATIGEAQHVIRNAFKVPKGELPNLRIKRDLTPNQQHEIKIAHEELNRRKALGENNLVLSVKVVERANTALQGSPQTQSIAKITIESINLKVPHLTPNDDIKLQLLTRIKADESMMIPFRRWELHELPALTQGSTIEIWSVKTCSALDSPRYVIVFFQTKKADNLHEDVTLFDNANIKSIRLALNSDYYPQERMLLDFSKDQYAEAHFNYTEFNKSYHNCQEKRSLVNFAEFKSRPMFVIDCSRRHLGMKSSTVDMNSTFKLKLQVEPPSTTSKLNLLVQASSSTFKFSLQVQTSSSTLKFNLQVQPLSSTYEYKLQVRNPK